VRGIRSGLGALALGLLLAGLWVAPAGAHASLVSTDPAAGATVTTSPAAVTLSFSEPVESALGGVRLFDARGRRVDGVGTPHRPAGASDVLTASLPDLDDGTYALTWRATSADSHPVSGSFTFSVGAPSTSAAAAESLATRLLTEGGGSSTVGVLAALARAGTFVGVTVLLGAAAFLVYAWPAGRADRRARRVVWTVWWVAFVGTAAAFLLQGPYVAGLGLGSIFDTELWSGVRETRFGQVALVRLVLLLLAVPLLRVLLVRRGPAVEHPLPQWWLAPALLVGLGLAATPGLAGHAATGSAMGLALTLDTLHVAAVGCWLGGLVLLLVPLAGRDEPTLRAVVPRYSQLALVSMLAIVLTGVAQAVRQVDALSDLVDTDYGRLLSAKVLVVCVLLLVATVSRDVVNRRWRVPEPVLAAELVPAGSGPPLPADEADEYPEGYVLDEPTAERRLRRSVWAELAIVAVVVALTALLVNAPPPRQESAKPFLATLPAETIEIETSLTPAAPGANELHLTALTETGAVTDVIDMTAQLALPEKGIAPIDVELLRAGIGHYIARDLTVPFAGDWELTVTALVTDVDSQKASVTVPIR